MGFQMQISSIQCFFWSILIKCCVHYLRMSHSKTQRLPQEKNIQYSTILIVLIGYRFVVIIYELCSLLSFVCHS